MVTQWASHATGTSRKLFLTRSDIHGSRGIIPHIRSAAAAAAAAAVAMGKHPDFGYIDGSDLIPGGNQSSHGPRLVFAPQSIWTRLWARIQSCVRCCCCYDCFRHKDTVPLL
jgi:hypothetical protein